MTPDRLLHFAIIPALSELSYQGIPDTTAARRFMLAIALQESRLMHRRQVTASGEENGPAMSYWQFEKGGGCKGVLTHYTCAQKMRVTCANFDVEATPEALWQAMQYNDVVAATAARLLIYSLPSKLPQNVADGWAQYLQAWRPGKPHPNTWAANWNLATIVAGED